MEASPLPSESPLVVAAAVGFVLLVGLLRYLSRPHTLLRVHGGRATLIRGAPPAGLVGELDAIARAAPRATGRIELTRGGHALKLGTPGLDPSVAQRVRNVVFEHRDRIR